jgi:hypothetical protein
VGKHAKRFMMTPAAVLLLAVLLLSGACSDDSANSGESSGEAPNGQDPEESTGPTTAPETTSAEPPEITLGEDPNGRPEVVLRLEGGRSTTFSGLCTAGGEENVLSGRVPKRFTFDLGGRELSCRIEKRDEGDGLLRVILIAGNTTRSVQQSNSPGSTINVSYRGG